MVIKMLSKEVEAVATQLFESNENIKTICLLKGDGNISLYLTKQIESDEGEKKRLAASIMASIVLAERSIINLVQEHVKHVVIKGENAITIIFMTKAGNYVYILADSQFEYKKILDIEFNF